MISRPKKPLRPTILLLQLGLTVLHYTKDGLPEPPRVWVGAGAGPKDGQAQATLEREAAEVRDREAGKVRWFGKTHAICTTAAGVVHEWQIQRITRENPPGLVTWAMLLDRRDLLSAQSKRKGRRSA